MDSAPATAAVGEAAPVTPPEAPKAEVVPPRFRWRRKPDSRVAIKELGLKMLSSLVAGLSTQRALPVSVSERMLDRIHSLLSSIEPQALFTDWSPPASAPEEPITLSVANIAVDSSRNTSTYQVSNMLSTVPTTAWQSAVNTKTCDVTVTLPKPQVLSVLELALFSKCTPESVTILTRSSEEGASFVAIGTLTGAMCRRDVRLPLQSPTAAPTAAITLRFNGFAENNKERSFGITNLRLLRATGSVHTDTEHLLRDLTTYLTTVGRTQPELRGKALKALQALSLASGSLAGVLSSAELMFADDLKPEAAASSAAFLTDLEKQYEDVCSSISVIDEKTSTIDAVFDALYGTVNVTDGGKVVRSTSSSNDHTAALVNVSFTKGKASWEFRLEEDQRDQECVCFGLGIKPVSRPNYDSSRELWMYRAYNGQIYLRGSASGSRMSKIHPGDVVRFDLDMDLGTCSAAVNGADQGVVFSDLAGLEVYPAVCFYSSGRAIRVLKVECPQAGKATYMCNLPESLEGSNIHGVLGKRTTLSGASDRVIQIGDHVPEYGLSTPVPSDGVTCVAYELDPDQQFDCFDAWVGLNDPPTMEAKESEEEKESKSADENRTVTYEVLADGTTQFIATDTLPPGSNPCMTPHRIVLNIKGVRRLELKVSCSGQSDKLFPVWIDPRVRGAPWVFDRIEHTKKQEAAGLASPATPATSKLFDFIRQLSRQSLKSMRSVTSLPPFGSPSLPLELPFCVQVRGDVFTSLARLLETAVTAMKASPDTAHTTELVLSLLTVIKANLRRLVASGVTPEFAGVVLDSAVGSGAGAGAGAGSSDGAAAQEGSLTLLHKLLDGLSGVPGEPTPAGIPLPVCVEAANVVDMGLELFYPTASAREELLQKLVSRGGVVEVNFLWLPPKDRPEDKEDHRFERAMLLLQCYAAKNKWRFATHGQFGRSIHLVLSLSTDAPISTFLTKGLSDIFTRAGFPSWSFPAGCSTPPINFTVERHLAFDREERLTSEPGVGWIRLYPEGVGKFEEVVEQVETHVEVLAESVLRQEAEEKARADAEAARKAAEPDAAPESAVLPEVTHSGSDSYVSSDDDSDTDESDY